MGSRLDSYYFSTATRLTNGDVLIAGGYSRPGGAAVNHAWLCEPWPRGHSAVATTAVEHTQPVIVITCDTPCNCELDGYLR